MWRPGENLVAVDIGNSRIKFAHFDNFQSDSLPQPNSELHLSTNAADWRDLHTWLRSNRSSYVVVSSVVDRLTSSLVSWLSDWNDESGEPYDVHVLGYQDLALKVDVDVPERVGMDRLVGAVAANRLRHPERPAIVVDMGTAITVNLIRCDGVFAGGAILPGLEMSARALYEFTDRLPQINADPDTDRVNAVGRSTESAIRSGILWGAIGAIKEIILRMTDDPAVPPHVFLTGGSASSIVEQLAANAQYVPHLKFAGIAISAQNDCEI